MLFSFLKMRPNGAPFFGGIWVKWWVPCCISYRPWIDAGLYQIRKWILYPKVRFIAILEISLQVVPVVGQSGHLYFAPPSNFPLDLSAIFQKRVLPAAKWTIGSLKPPMSAVTLGIGNSEYTFRTLHQQAGKKVHYPQGIRTKFS